MYYHVKWYILGFGTEVISVLSCS